LEPNGAARPEGAPGGSARRAARSRPAGAPDETAKLRARLFALGAQALSERELLALLVGGHASKGLSSVGADSLERLRHLPVGEMESSHGPAAAARIVAALELGVRAAAQPVQRGRLVHGPADVHGMFGAKLRHQLQEEFHVVLLDTRHRLLRTWLVTRGTADTSLVHSREVFREAVREGASAVILVHNHPSGDPRPSPEDRTVTRQLVEAGNVVGIPVLDHVIVGDGRYVSLAEEGALMP
jgi:DNA repair protein RadC